jgi:hypothetical protein
MTPSIRLDARETVEDMHAQFEKWFATAVRRVGLGEAVVADSQAAMSAVTGPITADTGEGAGELEGEGAENLPWIPVQGA